MAIDKQGLVKFVKFVKFVVFNLFYSSFPYLSKS